jgi:hypothetical protein
MISERKKKEKIVGNSLSLYYGHHSSYKELARRVQTRL